MTVYVLRCRLPRLPGEDSTDDPYWYVGWSNNVDRRFREHRGELRGKRDRHLGAAWTHLYYPEAIVETRIGNLETETSLTLEYMTMYGISRVRGGIYHAPDLGDRLEELAAILPVGCGCGHDPRSCPRPRTPEARAPYPNPLAQSRDPAAAASGYLEDMTPAKAAHISAAPTITNIAATSDPAAAARMIILDLYGFLPPAESPLWHRSAYDIHRRRRHLDSPECAAAAAVLARLGATIGTYREWYRSEHRLDAADKAALATVGGRIVAATHGRFGIVWIPAQ